LIDRNSSYVYYLDELRGQDGDEKHTPTASSSRILAFDHFVMSPPFPQPISRTLPLARACTCVLFRRAGWAKREMSIDLTQLLKFLSPMMGDSWRWTTPTSGRELSVCNIRNVRMSQKAYEQ